MISKRILFIPLSLFLLSAQAQENIEYKDTVNLNDVVVVGYGTQTRNQLTKSVSSIKSEDIQKLAPVSMSVQDILASGLAGGVYAVQNSGEPGAALTINVRGTTSAYLNMTSSTMNNAPLYVIDGVPTYLEATPINPLFSISPNDIESIDVLKDAAATAIYGSRGANGVIMIKTKSGRKNMKPRFSFGYTFSVSNQLKHLTPLNNAEYRDYQSKLLEAGVNQYNKGLWWDMGMLEQFGKFEPTGGYTVYGDDALRFTGLREDVFGNESIDWEREIVRKNAVTHNYNFTVEGGTDKTVYNISLHGTNQEGLYKKDDLTTFGGRLAVTTELSRYVKVGVAANYSESKRDYAITEESFWDTPLFAYAPDRPIMDSEGNYTRIDEIALFGGQNGAMYPNPVAMLNKRNNYDGNTFFTNGFVEINILEGLKFRSNFGYNKMKYDAYFFVPKVAKPDLSLFGQPHISNAMQNLTSYRTTTTNFQLDYSKDFKSHNLHAILGYETERSRRTMQSMLFEDFPNDNELSNAGSAKWVKNQGEQFVNSGMNSWFTRISYGYLNRYFADLSFRADGSSKFGPENRWAYFPAFSAGWVISREKFMKDAKWLDNLKFRASVGQTGSTNIDDFAYQQFYNSNGQYSNDASIIFNDMLPNRSVKWEKTTDYNLGLDFSLFNHRLYGNVDVYWRKTDGALAPSPHVLESGLSIYYDNIVDLENKGVEFTIGGEPISTKDFSWNTILNVARNKSKVTRLNNADIDPFFQDAYNEGHPIGVIKGYVVDYICQTEDDIEAINAISYDKYGEPYQQEAGVGDLIYKDLNGNGIIDVEDRTVIANPEPSFFGSWYNQFNYKNFALSFIMGFSVGAEALYYPIKSDTYGNLGHSVSKEYYANTWSPENTNARFGKPMPNPYNMGYETNNRMIYDASFLRMKNVTLSYQIPQSFVKKCHLSNAALFITATNLFTISSWPGRDPETVTAGVAQRGENMDAYPLGRTFSFGVNLNF